MTNIYQDKACASISKQLGADLAQQGSSVLRPGLIFTKELLLSYPDQCQEFVKIGLLRP